MCSCSSKQCLLLWFGSTACVVVAVVVVVVVVTCVVVVVSNACCCGVVLRWWSWQKDFARRKLTWTLLTLVKRSVFVSSSIVGAKYSCYVVQSVSHDSYWVWTILESHGILKWEISRPGKSRSKTVVLESRGKVLVKYYGVLELYQGWLCLIS